MNKLFEIQENALKTFQLQTITVAEQVIAMLNSEANKISLQLCNLSHYSEEWELLSDAHAALKYRCAKPIEKALSNLNYNEDYLTLHKMIMSCREVLQRPSKAMES